MSNKTYIVELTSEERKKLKQLINTGKTAAYKQRHARILLFADQGPKGPAMKDEDIGRKNWLFAGSDAGAERAAVIYSLIASCKLCEIDPFEYIRDVLDRISTHPASKIAELTPSGWKEYLTFTK